MDETSDSGNRIRKGGFWTSLILYGAAGGAAVLGFFLVRDWLGVSEGTSSLTLSIFLGGIVITALLIGSSRRKYDSPIDHSMRVIGIALLASAAMLAITHQVQSEASSHGCEATGSPGLVEIHSAEEAGPHHQESIPRKDSGPALAKSSLITLWEALATELLKECTPSLGLD